MSADITYYEAWRVIERDYWDDVRGIREEMKRAVKDGEVSDEDEFRDHLHEQVDGHQRVIYTHQARVGLCCSSHPDAAEDEMGEPARDVSAQMYWALMADVCESCDYDTIVSELESETE